MLFLLHVASKMRDVDDTSRGGKAGIVHNGSPLFNGGAGTGPSDIRGHMLENDLVEAIVALPNDMFYTRIATYLWIFSKIEDLREPRLRLLDRHRQRPLRLNFECTAERNQDVADTRRSARLLAWSRRSAPSASGCT